MKIKFTFLFLLFLYTTEFVWGIQQIETVVFPSEDEIAEACSLGEISFEQFLILTELIANRVNPSSFLLEEIPRDLLRFDTAKTTSNNLEQMQYFLESRNQKKASVTIRNQYSSYLNEEARSRYQSSVTFQKEQFEFNSIIRKEFSGRERFTIRYLAYISQDRKRTVIAGNFSKRFGLGGIIGYRSKILSYSDNIDTESFLFPDYGGFNGLYAKVNKSGYAFQSVISYHRNSNFSIFTNAFMLSDNNKNLPSLIVGLHALKNRSLNNNFYDIKTGLYKNFKYTNGQISTELVAEFNKQNNSSALLIDGKHKSKKLYLTYAFWNYGEAYLNIAGGSKTSLISEYVTIDNIKQSILSKRSNQTGGLIKTKLRVSTNWQIDIASLYAYKNSDTTEMQLFTQLTRKLSASAKISIDVLHRNKNRNKLTDNTSYRKNQSRLMLVYNPDNLYVRSYIQYSHKTDKPRYVGFFSEIKQYSKNYGLLHLWLSLSEINSNTKQLDYFYGFIKNEIDLFDSLSVSFKLSHRYKRSATDKNVNQFSLNMNWQI